MSWTDWALAVLDEPGEPTPLVEYPTGEAARILEVREVVPLHSEHWAHFTQGRSTLEEAFERAGLSDRLRLLKPGEQITVGG
ncbi:hypothetical protein GCM10010404_22020 [Nonomuraea africana]|uniref:Uncharacterized protein n=1 Tax=Nonomuraea africana TaxID=46171 RepID=A0ABR9KTV3_9ACTN|nr:hypothetical protein [Nonomuraea africana]MBE1565463.1 hypothetical protein [Nonomuraea africana]